ncbi:unnamed protein product, partial [Iphiclides podalirius]
MVRLKWAFVLIIISVTFLATVISAFRIRDLQKSSLESVSDSKKRQKCEDCDVNKLDLDQRLHVYKAESGKKSVEGHIKFAQETKKSRNEKTFEKNIPFPEEVEEISSIDDDESDENLIYLRQLASKWEEKQKASGVDIKLEKKANDKKKVPPISSTSDKVQEQKLKQKYAGDSATNKDKNDLLDQSTFSTKNVVSDDKKLKSLKMSVVNKDENDDDDENDNDDDANDFNNEKVDKGKSEEKHLKTDKHFKDIDFNQVQLSKENSKMRAKIDELKPKGAQKSSDKTKQSAIKTDVKDNAKNDIKSKERDHTKINTDSFSIKKKEKIVTDIHKDLPGEILGKETMHKKKLQLELKDTKTSEAMIMESTPIDVKQMPKVEASSKKVLDESKENESRENNRLRHVTEALHRRNLLKSEFEDFYAFLPTFASNFTRVQNPECRRHGQILLRQLRGTKLWALSMLDATGKIPSGILQGNGIQLGDFDQCLGSHARVQLDTGSVVKVQGKYCLAHVDLKAEHPELEIPVHLAQAKSLIKSRIDDPGHFVPRFSTLSWGVCVPAPCDPKDVEAIIRDAVKHYQYTSGVSIRVKVDPLDCHMHGKQSWWEEWLEIPTLLTLCLYVAVTLLVLVATAQDFVARRMGGSRSDVSDDSSQSQLPTDENNGNVDQLSGENLISAFSLYRTVGKLTAPATSDEISCIHGVRAIATIALLVAHKFLPVAVMPYTNRVKISEVVSSPLWSWCRAGWMYTDCFLLLSGTLTAHRISKDSDSGALRRIISRYLRLTPALLAVILFYAYVWDITSVGPMWGTLVTKNSEKCKEGWWWNVLYLQNYFGFEEMCAPQTHQLALDMQLSILGGVVVWAMQSDMPVLKAVLPTLHVWTAFSRYKTARDHRLTMLAYHGVSVSQLYRTARLSYMSVIHRSTPYLVGLSLGLALKSKTNHSKVLIAFGWLVSGVLWSLVWWAGLDSGSAQYRYNATFAAQYAALAPISSSLAIAWLIYAVHSGHCDFLQNILCSRPLALISRLSYALYLCQFIVFLTHAATVKTSREFTLMSLIDVQEISMILLTSVLLTLTFVTPMQSLPKILMSLSKSKTDVLEAEKVKKQPESPRKNEKVMELPKVRNRQTLIAHREVLEEIPEVDIEYEHQRDFHDGLEEILEEEENEEDAKDGSEHGDGEELEIIEEEQASVGVGGRRTRTLRAAMISLGVLLTIACAVQAIGLNRANITEQVLRRIIPLPDSPGSTGIKRSDILNTTAAALGLDTDALARLSARAKSVSSQAGRIADFSYITNAAIPAVGRPVLKSIEESPDYASSVVLASDLLSLTTAVGNVKEKACREQGTKFLDGLLQNKRWALKMFDASAKSPQGLLFGSSYHLGNFDECVGIDEPGGKRDAVEGEYCLATIKWSHGEEMKKVRFGRGETLRWAVCVPSSCSAKAVAGFVSDVLTHTVGNSTAVLVTERDCYTRRPMIVTNLDIGYSSFMLGIIVVLILCTLYEVYAISSGMSKTTWAVMDAEAWDRLIRQPANAFMLSNTLLVDTFLMLSAFLFCRLLLIEFDKRRGKLNVIPILVFRYIRITPAYVVVILFYMTWLPKIGEGPLWVNRMQLEQERCAENWWANILYVNNYIRTENLCMFQSWYLAVDTQLFFVAPIFIYSLWRWQRFGSAFLALATFTSLAIPSVITYKEHLDPTLLFYAKEFTDFVTNFYFREVYIKTHMKMTPYFMGLLTGYILHRIQSENYKLSRLMKTFGWITSIILGTVAVFSVSLFYQEWYEYSRIEAAAYVSLHKLAWSIANGWLLIACATGNGGILNILLTWKAFVPISRLTFCAYLVNGIVELYYVSQLRHPLHVTFFTMMANSVAHIILTFFLAIILCVIFESPIHGIEKILLRIFARPVLSDNARRDLSEESSRNTSQSKLDA